MKATRIQNFRPSRRQFLTGLSAFSLAQPTIAALAQNTTILDARILGLVTNSDENQSEILQAALNIASGTGVPLFLPGGTYRVSEIILPANLKLFGLPGVTILKSATPGPLLTAESCANITLEGITIEGPRGGNEFGDLLSFIGCENINLSQLGVHKGYENGIYLETCSGTISHCTVSGFSQTAIHAQNSTGLTLSQNSISSCGNGGIRVWRYENGYDGTLVTGNRISNIKSGSGDGQNGNGINIFRADAVIVSDNNINGCDFSAIRANSTNNTIIRGNICIQSKEVAIFSEFAFTGSIITDNLIDQAASGISITNFDNGGRLAICANNIVRNIWPASPTNPDTKPVGIFAEADTAISGNVVENVPGVGILAGWGPFLKSVLVSDNIVNDTKIGIGVSVADGAGNARIAGNMISGAKQVAISGMMWRETEGSDLATSPDQFPQVAVVGNSVS